MKLVAMMLVRNEEWVIEAAFRAAARWCDVIVVGFHACTDRTMEIVTEVHKDLPKTEVWAMQYPDGHQWNEMDLRQYLFSSARKAGGTHFALVDGDEILTGDLHGTIRAAIADLKAGQSLEVPMRSMRTLDDYQADDSVWARASITVAFSDRPDLHWGAAGDGYQHHARAPRGSKVGVTMARTAAIGGVMHLQFANRRRLLAKHVLYRMVDHLRWPNREDQLQLNSKYDLALKTDGILTKKAPPQWWRDVAKETILLDGVPWQEDEIKRLITEHGRERFAGLDLKGF